MLSLRKFADRLRKPFLFFCVPFKFFAQFAFKFFYIFYALSYAVDRILFLFCQRDLFLFEFEFLYNFAGIFIAFFKSRDRFFRFFLKSTKMYIRIRLSSGMEAIGKR